MRKILQNLGAVSTLRYPRLRSAAEFEALSAQIAARAYDRKWVTLALAALVTLMLGGGLAKLEFAGDYRAFFDADAPERLAFDHIEQAYAKSDNVFLVVTAADGGTIWRKDIIAAIYEATESAWTAPFSGRVDSITNYQHSYAYEDDLVIEALVDDPAALTQERIADIRAIAESEPTLAGRLVAPDGRATAINIEFRFPGAEANEIQTAVDAVAALARSIEEAHPEVDIALTGATALHNALNESARADIARLAPVMLAIIALATFVLTRSFWATVIAFAVIFCSTAAAMGAAGWDGVAITAPTAAAPNMILAIAVADSMHILVTALNLMRGGAAKRDALIESMRLNALPVFLTSVTTMVGLLTLNFAEQPPYRELGQIAAFGVFAAWIYSIILIPALFALAPIRIREQRISTTPHDLMSLSNTVIRHRAPVLAFGLALSAAWVVLATFNELDERFVDFFSKRVEFRQDTDFATERLAGLYQLHFSVPAAEPGGVAAPEYLRNLDRFSRWLRTQPDVRHVWTLADTMRKLNKNMNGDDPAYYALPDDQELAAQYLLLYELSLPLGLDLTNQIDLEKSATRVVATLGDVSSNRILELADAAEAWLAAEAPAYMRAEAAGPSVMFATIAKRTTRSLIEGTILAFAAISLIVMAALRSVRYGLVSLVFNMAPAAIAFGVWAAVSGQVSSSTSIVGALTLGVIVDATIHILTKYKRAFEGGAGGSAEAVRIAMAHAGPAIFVSTLVLIAGFSVFAFSDFLINARMGVLVALTIAIAMAFDFIVLPSFLTVLDRHRRAPAASLADIDIMRAAKPGASDDVYGAYYP
ncbi:MAG: MMPL family transporter [Parvularculaceae bacterium]